MPVLFEGSEKRTADEMESEQSEAVLRRAEIALAGAPVRVASERERESQEQAAEETEADLVQKFVHKLPTQLSDQVTLITKVISGLKKMASDEREIRQVSKLEHDLTEKTQEIKRASDAGHKSRVYALHAELSRFIRRSQDMVNTIFKTLHQANEAKSSPSQGKEASEVAPNPKPSTPLLPKPVLGAPRA